MLDRIAGNGVRTIIVESPDRFARDVAVQLAGHDHLRKLGVTLIPATAPDFFTEDTPTAVLVRQVLGAIAQFDKATLVAKLKAEHGIAPILPDRVEEVVSHARARALKAGVDPKLVEQIYRIIIDTACQEEEDYARAQQAKAPPQAKPE